MSNTNGKLTSRRQFLVVGCGTVAAICTGCMGDGGQDSTAAVDDGILSDSAVSGSADATQVIQVEETAIATVASTIEVMPEGEDVVTVSPSATAPPASDAVPVITRCPKGLVNDPYPGKCRRYIDEDGSGYCDLSEVSA